MKRVIVGMSGGVDSAVAAYLLRIAGYDVIGVTLRTWLSLDGKESRCCEVDDASMVCSSLGIPYYAFNCIAKFEKCVTKPFVRDYINGLTPNPCIECNRYIKWDEMLNTAGVMQADYIATGHYASIIKKDNGRYTVKCADHIKKDQAYMLYKLTQDQLKRTIMPLGKLSKEEVRNIAKSANIPVADKPDSQEICFVPDGRYTDYIRENAPVEIPEEGNFVDTEGNILGRHKGIINYTVGQRKGLGLPLGYPAFVVAIDTKKNEVIIGDENALLTREITVRDVNFMSIPGLSKGERLRCSVKIRYHHPGADAFIEGVDDTTVKVIFDEPVRAAAPGQSAVFYDDERCIVGGGIIV